MFLILFSSDMRICHHHELQYTIENLRNFTFVTIFLKASGTIIVMKYIYNMHLSSSDAFPAFKELGFFCIFF